MLHDEALPLETQMRETALFEALNFSTSSPESTLISHTIPSAPVLYNIFPDFANTSDFTPLDREDTKCRFKMLMIENQLRTYKSNRYYKM
jgi:hypothetical protein